jgi:ribonucleoside-diphosphate reductase alpha chain
MLIKLGIRYGSERAVDLCNQIGFEMANQAILTSAKLAMNNGTYPCYSAEHVLESRYFNLNTDQHTRNVVKEHGLHNSQLLTIAPTGTLSTMLGVSGGIEPIFANYYTRKTESLHGEDRYYKVYTPIVEEYMKKYGLTDDSELPEFFITAKDLNYRERINMQATWQKHIDASISSTVNVPNEFTVEDTEKLYMYAWESGLKGVTIFRDGCKRTAILTSDSTKETKEPVIDQTDIQEADNLPRGYITDVSDDLIGCKRKITTGCGAIHLEVYSDEITGEPQETFINIGSSGGCERNYQFISRLISMALRAGVPIEAIIDQAMSIRPCTAYVNRAKTKKDTSPGTSCPSAIGYALKDLYAKAKELRVDIDDEEETESVSTPKCPECGEPLVMEGGCNICKNCGWTKCD